MAQKKYYNFLLDKEMTRKEFFVFCGLGLISLFPIFKVINRLFSSHAQSPYAQIEAESGVLGGGAVKFANTAASGGQAVNFPAKSSGTGGGGTPTYSEEFATLDLITPSNPNGQWYASPNGPNSLVGQKDPAGSTWDANPNQTLPGVGVLNPFKISPITDSTGSSSNGNAFTITVQNSTAAIQTATGFACWGGTILQNADVKFFTVGNYIEFRALFVGASNNCWPAIWFFAPQGKKSGTINSSSFAGAEVDLVEPQGNIAKGYVSMHMREQGDVPNPNFQVNGSSDINGANFYAYPIVQNTWATYGFDWQSTGLTYYLNRKVVATETNPTVLSYFNQSKMGVRLDYTLQSDSLTTGPLSMSVDYIRAWPTFAASIA